MKDGKRARDIIIKSLGALWILDGLLQFQPNMFSSQFVTNVLMPNLLGQPPFLQSIVSLGIAAWSMHPVITNIFAALLQIAIGILLIVGVSKKSSDAKDTNDHPSVILKFALCLSVIWGLTVWIFGEGAGMLFTGMATFASGAPGSALIYAILAAMLLMPDETLSLTTYPKIAGYIFILCSLLQWQLVWLLFLTIIIGLLLVLKPNHTIGVIALIFLFAIWWFGQNFGGLGTIIMGTATDPNTAPVLALFLIPLFLM